MKSKVLILALILGAVFTLSNTVYAKQVDRDSLLSDRVEDLLGIAESRYIGEPRPACKELKEIVNIAVEVDFTEEDLENSELENWVYDLQKLDPKIFNACERDEHGVVSCVCPLEDEHLCRKMQSAQAFIRMELDDKYEARLATNSRPNSLVEKPIVTLAYCGLGKNSDGSTFYSMDKLNDYYDFCPGIFAGLKTEKGCPCFIQEHLDDEDDKIINAYDILEDQENDYKMHLSKLDSDCDGIANKADLCKTDPENKCTLIVATGVIRRLIPDSPPDPSPPSGPTGPTDPSGDDEEDEDENEIDLSKLDFFSREYEEVIENVQTDQADADSEGEGETKGNSESCSLISGGSGSSAISGVILLLSLAPLAIRRKRNK